MICAQLCTRVEEGRRLPMLVWRFDACMHVSSTAPYGGGVGRRRWIINAQVAGDYVRRDTDRHGRELAALRDLAGEGVVMLTAAKIRHVLRRAECDGVSVEATVGVGNPVWPADAADSAVPLTPGTINVVAYVPIRLSEVELLIALCKITEAKASALLSAGVPGTGTPTDAVTVVTPSTDAVDVSGSARSGWATSLAHAVQAAVSAGVTDRRS